MSSFSTLRVSLQYARNHVPSVELEFLRQFLELYTNILEEEVLCLNLVSWKVSLVKLDIVIQSLADFCWLVEVDSSIVAFSINPSDVCISGFFN